MTVVSMSRMVHEATAAAECRGRRRNLRRGDRPPDGVARSTPPRSSNRFTGRVGSLIAHEASVPFGIGAEIAATVGREGFWDLDAPIVRIGAATTPPAISPDLERAWLPDRHTMAAALRRLSRTRRGRSTRGRGRQQPKARAITRCWISLVPSPISNTLASQ